MKVKILELRDRGTFIPVFAFEVIPTNEGQRYLIRRAGYGDQPYLVMFGRLDGGKCTYDPWSWADRTYQTAHQHIEKNFGTLQDGDVIDVRYLLGEAAAPAISERLETW